jgi:hypothetical protein
MHFQVAQDAPGGSLMWANVVVGLGWLLVVSVIAGGLMIARGYALRTIDSPLAQEDWEDWREEAQRQAEGEGPVKRRPPRAEEPPTLMLLRDHFGACMTMGLVLSSVLYGTLALMIRGVLLGPRYQPQQPPPS